MDPVHVFHRLRHLIFPIAQFGAVYHFTALWNCVAKCWLATESTSQNMRVTVACWGRAQRDCPDIVRNRCTRHATEHRPQPASKSSLISVLFRSPRVSICAAAYSADTDVCSTTQRTWPRCAQRPAPASLPSVQRRSREVQVTKVRLLPAAPRNGGIDSNTA
jgi:hypothetical protein